MNDYVDYKNYLHKVISKKMKIKLSVFFVYLIVFELFQLVKVMIDYYFSSKISIFY